MLRFDNDPREPAGIASALARVNILLNEKAQHPFDANSIPQGPAPKGDRDRALWPQTFEGLRLHSGAPDANLVYRAVEASGQRWVVLMIHRCARGPGLMPVHDDLNTKVSLKWVAPPDCRITLTHYLQQFLQFFTGERWDSHIKQSFDDHDLPRYQCAVRESHWRACWDALQGPFALMCSAYRRILGGKSTPHLRFGVPPRLLDTEGPEGTVPDVPPVAAGYPLGFLPPPNSAMRPEDLAFDFNFLSAKVA
jgi:hypothetical protein